MHTKQHGGQHFMFHKNAHSANIYHRFDANMVDR